jgi:hypothetical protein
MICEQIKSCNEDIDQINETRHMYFVSQPLLALPLPHILSSKFSPSSDVGQRKSFPESAVRIRGVEWSVPNAVPD